MIGEKYEACVFGTQAAVIAYTQTAASYITGTELEVTGGHIKVLNAQETWKNKKTN